MPIAVLWVQGQGFDFPSLVIKPSSHILAHCTHPSRVRNNQTQSGVEVPGEGHACRDVEIRQHSMNPHHNSVLNIAAVWFTNWQLMQSF